MHNLTHFLCTLLEGLSRFSYVMISVKWGFPNDKSLISSCILLPYTETVNVGHGFLHIQFVKYNVTRLSLVTIAHTCLLREDFGDFRIQGTDQMEILRNFFPCSLNMLKTRYITAQSCRAHLCYFNVIGFACVCQLLYRISRLMFSTLIQRFASRWFHARYKTHGQFFQYLLLH